MSRIGKQVIEIPQKTEVTISDEGVLSVKGPHGELQRTFRPTITIAVENGEVKLSPKKETQFGRALWGTYASHVKNMIAGVNEPFVKKLIVEGVGFRSQVSGDKLVLNIGFSHPVEKNIPTGLTVTAEKNVITVTGIDKEMVGAFSAQLRALKKPEPYKGKGIRYENEVIRRKEGKKSA
ncbi:MAG TPA: 50S ribosomal protein L6 [Candidatus Paceibacterota bacterium]|nr:50S ribosomal protein L6 [Candidatus Paceibacterota bacterium]